MVDFGQCRTMAKGKRVQVSMSGIVSLISPTFWVALWMIQSLLTDVPFILHNWPYALRLVPGASSIPRSPEPDIGEMTSCTVDQGLYKYLDNRQADGYDFKYNFLWSHTHGESDY
jgi:hypothetical protein